MPKELEPSEAVRHAKEWLKSVYEDEVIRNVGLEEVRWKGGNWEITLEFDRFADEPLGLPASVLAGLSRGRRDYKVVILSADNRVIAMRNREAMAE